MVDVGAAVAEAAGVCGEELITIVREKLGVDLDVVMLAKPVGHRSEKIMVLGLVDNPDDLRVILEQGYMRILEDPPDITRSR